MLLLEQHFVIYCKWANYNTIFNFI